MVALAATKLKNFPKFKLPKFYLVMSPIYRSHSYISCIGQFFEKKSNT